MNASAAASNKRWLNAVRPRELGDVYRAAIEAGCDCAVGKNTHVKIKTPSGAVIGGPMTGGNNAARTMRSKLKKYGGVDLDG